MYIFLIVPNIINLHGWILYKNLKQSIDFAKFSKLKPDVKYFFEKSLTNKINLEQIIALVNLLNKNKIFFSEIKGYFFIHQN